MAGLREHDNVGQAMTDFHLTALSFTVVAVIHQSLKRLFRRIEKAHQRKPGPRNNGVQLSGEKAA